MNYVNYSDNFYFDGEEQEESGVPRELITKGKKFL